MNGKSFSGDNNRTSNYKLGKHYLTMTEEGSASMCTNKSQDNSGCKAITVGNKKADVALGRLRERTPGRERTAQGNGEPFSCFTTSELRVNKDRGSNYASEKSPSFPRGDGEPVLVGEKERMTS